MSYFSVNREFFVIESTHLEDVATRLFGFVFVDDRVAEDIASMGVKEPNGDGAYVFVKRKESSITITQDFMGSYGLYVFQEGGYFALSNPFMKLLEHLKSKASN